MRNGRAAKDGFGRPKSGVKEDEVKRDIFVMILDDEQTVGERLKPVLEKKGVQVEIFTESQKALERLAEKKFHVLITDLTMSGPPSGFDVLHFLQEHSSDTLAVITSYATIERAREAQYLNAKFIPKPFKLDQIVKLVGLATKKSNYIIYRLKNKIYQISSN